MIDDPLIIVGMLFALACLMWVYHVSKSDKNTYELADLITTKSRMDLSKVGQLVCLLATTWVVIHMELKLPAGIPEWALGLYMLAWVGAGFSSLFARMKGSAGATSEITTTSTTTEKTQAPAKENA